MFHTAYNSFESKPNGRDYIGKHSSKDPYDEYKGSFKDETFNPDQKIILAYSKTAEGAVWFEINFQKVFNVVEEPQFVNRSLQTSTGFDTTGMTRIFTEEHKQRMSQARIGIVFTPEHLENLSKGQKGAKKPGSGPKYHPVEVVCPDGVVIEFKTILEFCKHFNLPKATARYYLRKQGVFIKGRLRGFEVRFKHNWSRSKG